jgi:hypothetical protein
MATSDTELMSEVRAMTHYDTSIVSDSTMQTLIDVGKKEIEADFPETPASPFPGFYAGNLQIDRALFWFVCIAAKIRVGEISGISISSGQFLDVEPSDTDDPFLFRNFQRRLANVMGKTGPGQIQVERDGRTYGDGEWPD